MRMTESLRPRARAFGLALAALVASAGLVSCAGLPGKDGQPSRAGEGGQVRLRPSALVVTVLGNPEGPAIKGDRVASLGLARDEVLSTLEGRDSYLVKIQFDSEGSLLFQDLTGGNLGAILVVSSWGQELCRARVRDEIASGILVIQAGTLEEATALRARLGRP